MKRYYWQYLILLLLPSLFFIDNKSWAQGIFQEAHELHQIDPMKTYKRQDALNLFTDCCQGPQNGRQYKSDCHPRATPPKCASILNGHQPPDHGRGSNGHAGTNPHGEPIITKQARDPNAAETAVRSNGPTTTCAYQCQTLVPQSMVDHQPYWQHAGTFETPLGKRHAVGGAVNETLRSLGNNIATKGDAGVAVSGLYAQSGMPLTQSSLATLVGGIGDQIRQQVSNPAAVAQLAKGAQQIQYMQNSDNQANACRANCASAFEMMRFPLINVANEESGSPCSSDQAFKSEANVAWMVQHMYKSCYIPMAVLLLLPGAVLTQVKSLVSSSFCFGSHSDEDTSSPFAGLIRSIIAVFLIPATQLTLSYCIDIGNALTDSVAKQVNVDLIMSWVDEQAYASDPRNNDGCIKNITGKACQGKLAGTSVKTVVQERQADLTVAVQNWSNTINNMSSLGLEVLNGFQFVMVLYLFLLGPIAAALYAWPAAVGKDLFKKSFASWLDSVVVLSLWKFWWCIVLLCMMLRLQQGVHYTDPFEMYYFTAFMGILVMVPFQPFDFRPGELVSSVLARAQQQGAGGAAATAGTAGAGVSAQGPKVGGSAGNANSVSTASTIAGSKSDSPALLGGTGTADKQDGNSDSAGASDKKSESDSIEAKPIEAKPIAGNLEVQHRAPPMNNS